ncbi:RQCD1 [Cordylochernes scorpioides]|uniref:CCR4-NOT transcription complex subunit 9 n=1 Tax=Cordylochernes scorpioides TaxID=51811 RepID=A0ABY6LYK1_9ARAC|nr:RQCD1 [Cordylochernes scorpioides]
MDPFSNQTRAPNRPNVSQVPLDQLINHWINELSDPSSREAVLHELSKYREALPNFAPMLWNSFGTVAILLQEITSVYSAIVPPTLTTQQSNRICYVLSLLQTIASHPETNLSFVQAEIPSYLFPFLKTSSKEPPFGYLRITTLGVFGALLKTNDQQVIRYLLTTEIIPLCLNAMETGCGLSKTIAIFILQKVIMDDEGDSRLGGQPKKQQVKLRACLFLDYANLDFIGDNDTNFDKVADLDRVKNIHLTRYVRYGVQKFDSRVQQLESSLEDTTCAVASNAKKISEFERRVEFLVMKSREKNLVFYGIEGSGTETSNESCVKIKRLLKDNMQIYDEIDVSKCWRLSKRDKAAILVEVSEYSERMKILKNSFKPKDLNVFVNKDYSPSIREQRRILIYKRKELLNKGINAKLRDNKLIVNDTFYQVSNELAKYPFLINQEKLTTDAFRAVGPHQRGASCTFQLHDKEMPFS